MMQLTYVVTGDPAIAVAAVSSGLQSNGFTITPIDAWSATAESGNRAMAMILGAFVLYMKLGVSVASSTDGQSIVSVDQQSKGWLGGAIGVHRTNKKIAKIEADLEAALRSVGNLVTASRSA